MELKGRKVEMFRCHIDPMLGPKPRHAFTVGVEGIMDAELTPAGVAVTVVHNVPGNKVSSKDHLVPFANIQSIKFQDEVKEEKEEKKAEKK